MVSINEVKHVQIGNDLDNASVALIRLPHEETADYSITSSDIDNTLYLQPGRRLLLLQ